MYDPLKAKAKVVMYATIAFLMGLGLASGFGWTGSSFAMPTLQEAPQVSEEAVRPARELSNAFIEVSGVVTPAVVRIEATIPGRTAARNVPAPLERFFRQPEQGEPQPQIGGGSGFIVSEDGYILTNNHVVQDAEGIRVFLPDRRYFDAELVGRDPFTDVAVVKIDVDEDLPTLSFGDSDHVRVGEWVLAVGNPGFGSGEALDYTVTAGIVSARGRGLGLIGRELQREFMQNPRTQNLAGFAIEDFIQTDAVINPGNSGGPMVDLTGRVVGINSAIASRTGYYQGYGFAVPVNIARRVMKDLIEYGHVRRPLMGVQIGDVAPEDAEAYDLPSVSGVLVQSVTEGGPADDAGLQQEDVIVSIEGKRVGYSNQLQQRIAQFYPGDEVTVTYYRDGERRQTTVELGEAPTSQIAEAPPEPAPDAEARLGFTVAPLDAERAREFGFDETGGVVITGVQRASPAARRGIGPGYKIVAIDDEPIETPADVGRALAGVEGGDVTTLHLVTPTGTANFVNVRMPRD